MKDKSKLKGILDFVWSSSPHNKDKNILIAIEEIEDLTSPAKKQAYQKGRDDEYNNILEDTYKANEQIRKQAIQEFISKLPTKQDLIDACDNYSEELDTKIHFDDGWSQYRDEVIKIALDKKP